MTVHLKFSTFNANNLLGDKRYQLDIDEPLTIQNTTKVCNTITGKKSSKINSSIRDIYFDERINSILVHRCSIRQVFNALVGVKLNKKIHSSETDKLFQYSKRNQTLLKGYQQALQTVEYVSQNESVTTLCLVYPIIKKEILEKLTSCNHLTEIYLLFPYNISVLLKNIPTGFLQKLYIEVDPLNRPCYDQIDAFCSAHPKINVQLLTSTKLPDRNILKNLKVEKLLPNLHMPTALKLLEDPVKASYLTPIHFSG